MNERWRNILNASREPAPFNAVWNIAIVAVFGACAMVMNGWQPRTQDTHLIRTMGAENNLSCQTIIPTAVADSSDHRVALSAGKCPVPVAQSQYHRQLPY
jgi:hypothetical protein